MDVNSTKKLGYYFLNHQIELSSHCPKVACKSGLLLVLPDMQEINLSFVEGI